MSKVLVSVICTNYNKGDWIRDAIESFLCQKTNFEYEIILVDDKSTDGSQDIIKQYTEKYPDKIRAFYNDKNLGITRTWIKICKEAKGKYIARCDGDDYWIDDKKLQKQVDLLEKNKDSKWCSTDSDTINESGIIQHSVFENHIIDHPDTYAKMLATRGFTAPSTWLVQTDLMQEINTEIDKTAIDDTFNIQLDLFNKTKLTYLPDSTAIYRINDGSDSRPKDIKDITARNKKLLKTQLEYIRKYPNVEYEEILKTILPRTVDFELQAIERLQILREQERIIKRQNAHIKNLETSIGAIQNSKKYQVVAKTASVAHKSLAFPKKAARKMQWLEGRRRYDKYYKDNFPTEDWLDDERSLAKKLAYKPLISIVVPTYNTSPDFFNEMLESVKSQTYTKWELIFIDDASPDGTVRKLIQEASQNNDKIKHKFLKKNQHIAGATNEGFKIAKGEFVSLLDHDDLLHPSALFEVAKALNRNQSLDFIYTDEDKINENNMHVDPFIKPDWNQEFLYSVNYITHFTTIRKAVIDQIGGERGEYNGAQDWDLFLRATRILKPENIYHIPKILYSWRVHDASTAKNLDTKPYVFEVQRKLLKNHFQGSGLTNDQFSIQENPYMQGAWIVSYEGQETKNLHKSGEPVNYAQIPGLSKRGDEIIRYFGRRSIVEKIYTDCQYKIEDKTSGRGHA